MPTIATLSGNLTPPLILYNSSFFRGSTRTVPFFYLVLNSYTDNLSNLDNLRNHTQTARRIYSLCSPHTIFLRCFIGVMHRLILKRKSLVYYSRQDFDFECIISYLYQSSLLVQKVMNQDLIVFQHN